MCLVDEIKNAVASHGEWKNILRSAIKTGKIDARLSALQADDQCSFGTWLNGETIPEKEKSSVHYQRARELHAAFHEAASKFVRLFVSGKKEAALRMLEVKGEFTAASLALTSCMLTWLIEAKKRG